MDARPYDRRHDNLVAQWLALLAHDSWVLGSTPLSLESFFECGYIYFELWLALRADTVWVLGSSSLRLQFFFIYPYGEKLT